MARTFTTPQGENITLSPDQDAALDRILAVLKVGNEAVLAGAAGCGKSVIMFPLIEEWRGNVLLMSPTGKAAARLSEVTSRTTSTIHSAIYRTVEETQGGGDGRRGSALVFGEPDVPKRCGRNTLVLVDEAAMANRPLADELRKQVFSVGGKILAVGDHEQLPPVEGGWGFDFVNPTARLTQVHRQALESPVLELATLIREGRGGQFTNWGDEVQKVDPCTLEQAVAWMEESRAVDALAGFASDDEQADLLPSRVLITFTNSIRTKVNRLVRKSREYPKNEVVSGETLLCTFNQHSLGKMNGEMIEVHEVEPCEEMTKCLGVPVQWVTERDAKGSETRFLVIPSLFDAYHPRKSDHQLLYAAWRPLWAVKAPKRDSRTGETPENVYDLCRRMGWRWSELSQWRDICKMHQAQATWGYCLTTHRSQGSQWDEVGFISCPAYRNNRDREFVRRMTYTAVTRAAKRFTAFVLRVVPNYNRKHPYGEE